MDYRYILCFVVTLLVYHYRGRGPLLYCCVTVTFPFIRRLLLRLLSALVYKSGLSAGYVSLWNHSIMGIGFRRKSPQSQVELSIGEIRISSFRPLEVVVSDISLSVSSRLRVKQSLDSSLSEAVEVLQKEGSTNLSRLIQLAFSVFTKVLSLVRVRVTNISVRYSKYPPLPDVIVELQEFTFHPISDSNPFVIPFVFSLEEFTIITRETIFSQGRPDVHIPRLLLNLTVPKQSQSPVPQEIQLSLEDGYSVHVSSSSIRYFLGLLHSTSSKAGSSKTPPLLERRLPLVSLYSLHRLLIPSKLDVMVARAEHFLHANRLVLPVHCGFEIHYNAVYGDQNPKELSLDVSLVDLIAGSITHVESVTLALRMHFHQSLRTMDMTIEEWLDQVLDETTVSLRLSSPSLQASPEYAPTRVLLPPPRKLEHMHYIGTTLSSLLKKHRSASLENSPVGPPESFAEPMSRRPREFSIASASAAAISSGGPSASPPPLMAVPVSLPPPLKDPTLSRKPTVSLRRFTSRSFNPLLSTTGLGTPMLAQNAFGSHSVQSALQRLGRLRLFVTVEFSSISVRLSESLMSPAFSTFSVQRASCKLSVPPSPMQRPELTLTLYSIQWEGTVISRSCSHSPLEDAPGRILVLPEVSLKLSLDSMPALVLDASLSVPSLHSSLDLGSLTELLGLFSFIRRIRSLLSAPPPLRCSRAESSETPPSLPVFSPSAMTQRMFLSFSFTLQDVRLSFHGLSTEYDGLIAQFPLLVFQFSQSRASSLLVLNRFHLSSFRSHTRDILSFRVFTARLAPSKNEKLKIVSIGINCPNFNCSFGFLYEVQSLVKKVSSLFESKTISESRRGAATSAPLFDVSSMSAQASFIFSSNATEPISRSASVVNMRTGAAGAAFSELPRFSQTVSGARKRVFAVSTPPISKSVSDDAIDDLQRASGQAPIPRSQLKAMLLPPPPKSALELRPPPKLCLRVTVAGLSVSLDLDPWVWRWTVESVNLQRHNRGAITASVSSLRWSLSDQNPPFLSLHSLRLRMLPLSSIVLGLIGLKIVYDEKSHFGEELGVALSQRKVMKTLLRGFVCANTHPGRDQKLVVGFVEGLTDPLAVVSVEASLSRFSFTVLGDSRTFSRPLVTDHLGDVRIQRLQLMCEWNPALHCRAGLLKRVRALDESPLSPLAYGYDDVLGCELKQLSCSRLSVYLGDYPSPLLEATNVSISGFVSLALVDTVERSIILVPYTLTSFGFFPTRRQVVERGGDNVKVYCDLSAAMSTCHISFGIFMGELLSVFSDAIGDITPQNIDKVSPKLMWWDKLRYMIHGKYQLESRHHLTMDLFYSYPYDCDKLRLIFRDFSVDYSEASKIRIRSQGGSGYVLTASSVCDRFLRVEGLICTVTLGWTTRGNPLEHHVFQQDVYEPTDIYFYYRSQRLRLSMDLDFYLPEHSFSSSPITLWLNLTENVVWLLRFVKMFLASFSQRSLTLGVLMTQIEIKLTMEKPRLVIVFDSSSSHVYSVAADHLTVRVQMEKILFGPERHPLPNSKSALLMYSMVASGKNVLVHIWERCALHPSECPEPDRFTESNLMVTIQDMQMSTGLDESRYLKVLSKQQFDINFDLMEPSNPNFIDLVGLQVVFTFLTKRHLFTFKDSLLGILFPPPYLRRDSIPTIFQRSRSHWRIFGSLPRQARRETENPLLQQILVQTKGNPNYKFMDAVKPSPAQTTSMRFRLSMILKAKNFQILFMTPDTPLNTILVGKKLLMAFTVKNGRLSQEISKMEAFIKGGSSYILLQGPSSKFEWITPSLLERIKHAADTDSYHISPNWLKETEFSFVYNSNSLPPTSVNMLDPVIQSDELSKISVFIPRMDIQATSRDLFQAIETFRNIIFFSFSSSTSDPPPHKPGANKLPSAKMDSLRNRLETKLALTTEEDHSVTSVIQFHSGSGTFMMLDDTGVNFATMTFKEFKFNRYSHQDLSVLNTFSIHCFHFRVNPPAFRESLDRDILSPSNDDIPLEDNMLTALAEMSPMEVIDGWPITVYNNIEISVFPCSTTVLRITLIAKLLDYINHYVFQKTDQPVSATTDDNGIFGTPQHSPSSASSRRPSDALLRSTAVAPQSPGTVACNHEYERYNASTAEEPCAICRRVVKDMTTVQYQCRVCGSKVHAYCKDTAATGVNDETIIYLNSLRIGDLKLMVSIKGFRVNLQEWETTLNMKSVSKRFSFWSSVSSAVMSEYQSELLRRIPAIIMKKLSRKRTASLSLDTVSRRLQRFQLSKDESEREHVDQEMRKEMEKWNCIFDDEQTP